jgi:hypothetical protein
MFKHFFIIIILIIVLSYYIISFLSSYFYKLTISESILKYSLTENDIKFFKKYSKKENLKNVKKGIFYTQKQWNTKNNNYIYDSLKDRYYLIDKGYYYYISNTTRYKIVIKNDIVINLINLIDFNLKIYNLI